MLAGGMLASLGDWRPVFALAVAVLGGGLVAFLCLAKGHAVLTPLPEDTPGGSRNGGRVETADQ